MHSKDTFQHSLPKPKAPFRHKVSRSNLAAYLNRKLVHEWCIVRCDSKNAHQKDMCLEELRLSAQNFLPIPSSIIDMIEGRPI